MYQYRFLLVTAAMLNTFQNNLDIKVTASFHKIINCFNYIVVNEWGPRAINHQVGIGWKLIEDLSQWSFVDKRNILFKTKQIIISVFSQCECLMIVIRVRLDHNMREDCARSGTKAAQTCERLLAEYQQAQIACSKDTCYFIYLAKPMVLCASNIL